jgi:pilus assembly protein CpaB
VIVDSWSLQRRWRRLQRPLGMLLVVVGAGLLWAREHAPQPTVATVVAVADVAVGEVVDAADVRLVGWPADSRPPPAASDTAGIVGRRAAATIRSGEPLTAQRVVGPGALAGPQQVAVAIPEDPLAGSGLVRPGDLVNLVGRTEAGPRTLVTGASVLTLIDDSGAVLAVPADAAATVVQSAATDSIAMVLLGRG